jgi:hypothetical protein
MEYPKLIESGVRSYMQETLSSCHDNRIRIYSFALNSIVLLTFIAVVVVTLYYCHKRKPTPYEMQQKILRDQQYVLSKIRFYQNEQKNLMTSPLGNLPSFRT